MENVLTTDRLVLRPYAPADAEAFFDIYCDPRAMRFMPSLPHQNIDETRSQMAIDAGRPGAYSWSIWMKGESRPIGHVNFLGETRIPGMGYILHPDYWGQGIVPEACRAALAFGFEQIGYNRVELWIDETNMASLRVAQKLRFKPKGRIALKYNHETTHHFMLVFGMLASEWRGDDAPEKPGSTRFFSAEPVFKVHNVLESAHFYRDRLGFWIDFLYGDPPVHGAVSRGEWTGSMVTVQLSQVEPGGEIGPASSLYIFIDTSLDALCERYRGSGVEIVTEPETRPWGLREFTARDLDGHTLVFATSASF